ncbi:MAG: hypothetical protein BGN95_19965 [Sphingomonas sp. 66-10]|uniref:DOMON-like domain-containing protein n=1 Tax=Sphingomonas sp. 66-10 TaxID=1895848 RepID=UPI0009271716|nr:DOMON-like domain-containing protein [Sphingomonas sp. 66-10]OJU17478.1 MAG: hypothetical protein BGN95_19965 [Sphingomonas sp. 66-10]
MASFTLIPHPDFPPLRVRGVSVELERNGSETCLRYAVDGADAVIWPAPAALERADELWKATCFELFVMPGEGAAYLEFNFSPSGRWAAYAFDAYRAGMHDLPLSADPKIERSGHHIIIRHPGLEPGSIAPQAQPLEPPAPRLPPDGPRLKAGVTGPRIALTAVIEETGGVRSFWALAHAPGAPDFHNPDCFVARLPAPDRA